MSIKEIVERKTKSVPSTSKPPRFKVLLLNDDYTSMDFVVGVLINIFGHSLQAAIDIMLIIHKEGQGICGIYTYEIAETKVFQVESMARAENFPLRAIVEEE